MNGADHSTAGDALVAHVGDPLSYTVTVTNTGEIPLTLVSLTDSLFAGLPASCSQGLGSTLAAGATVTCAYAQIAAGDVTNVASVTGLDGHGRRPTAADATFVDVINPAISIVKTASPDSFSVSGDVTYTYVVTNTGDTPLGNVTVTDDILGAIGVVATLAPAASRPSGGRVHRPTCSLRPHVGRASAKLDGGRSLEGMARVVVATADGVHEVGSGGGGRPVGLAGQEVTAVAADDGALWAVVGGKVVARSEGGGDFPEVASVDRWEATWLLALPSGLLVGTEEAHVLRLAGERLEPLAGFEAAPGRDGWYTPWGGPAAVRSMSAAADGTLLVNVHVGGILRSTDDGATWGPTVDIHADVHQVLAVGADGGLALGAAAVGLLVSGDGGASWEVVDDGLHATYCRAVAATGEHLVVSASTGPRGDRSALYRRALGRGPLERCRDGLPEWLPGNVDTGCLAAGEGLCAFATHTGLVFASTDEGATWRQVADGLPPVRALAVVPG